jgi:hypothetical protein
MMTRSSSSGWGQSIALLVGVAFAALLMRQAIAQEATPEPSGHESAVINDGACEPDNACRSQHGNIFFGRVVDVVETGRFKGGLDLFYVVYTVDVEESLRRTLAEGPEGREAKGRVQIQVSGIDLPIEDKGRSAPLTVGERYLFFAGLNMDKGYLVDAEVGFLPVASDEEAEELTAEFTPLIRQAEQKDQAVIARATNAARSAPQAAPAAEIVPARGPAGSEVVVTGSGFTPADVLLLWDEDNPEQLPEVAVDADGRFEITLTVPKGLAPGRHTLWVEGLGSDVVELTFDVEE